MATSALQFVLPLPPNMANGRMHWRTKHRERQRYFKECDDLQLLGLVPRPPAQPLPHATVAATVCAVREMDDDNAMARVKWSLDWLKTRGYIVDDSRKCLQWAGLPNQRTVRSFSTRVELTITPR